MPCFLLIVAGGAVEGRTRGHGFVGMNVMQRCLLQYVRKFQNLKSGQVKLTEDAGQEQHTLARPLARSRFSAFPLVNPFSC
jgi:hypothetical protein